jgi:hypothetical protein
VIIFIGKIVSVDHASSSLSAKLRPSITRDHLYRQNCVHRSDVIIFIAKLRLSITPHHLLSTKSRLSITLDPILSKLKLE